MLEEGESGEEAEEGRACELRAAGECEGGEVAVGEDRDAGRHDVVVDNGALAGEDGELCESAGLVCEDGGEGGGDGAVGEDECERANFGEVEEVID